MTLEQIEAALATALPMRVPRFDAEHTNRVKVEALENYMLASAHANGDLVEARHWLRLLETALTDRWDKLQGWETFTSKPRLKLSAADIKAAKILAAPHDYDAIRKTQALRVSIDDQIARLEREERVCSRAYTMIAG